MINTLSSDADSKNNTTQLLASVDNGVVSPTNRDQSHGDEKIISWSDWFKLHVKRVFTSEFLIILLVLCIIIVSIIISAKVTNDVSPTPIRVEFGLCVSLFITSLICVFGLVLFNNAASISETIANRFNFISYLTIYIIIALAYVTSALSSSASINVNEEGSIYSFLGPILCSGIILFPLIIRVKARKIQVHEYLSTESNRVVTLATRNHNEQLIALEPNEKVIMVLHTKSELIATIFHFAFVITGYSFMLYGYFPQRSHARLEVNITCNVLISISILFIVIFGIIGVVEQCYSFYNTDSDDEKLNRKDRMATMRLFCEYIGLSLMMMAQDLWNADVLNMF